VILEGRDLCFAYRSPPVLKNVNVRVTPGVTAIIGPNAAGKSTLLKCLAGLLTPRGNVSLVGGDTARLSSLRQAEAVSYLPQSLSTQATLTVFEAVLLGRLHKLRWRVGSDDVRLVEELLEEFSLSDLASRNITELSGGQLQMVSIAQALARQPRVLLLDEPTSNLDLQHQFEICSIIAKLTAARGMSTAMALHDLNVAACFADIIYVLKDGAVHCSGPPADVLTEAMIRDVYRVAANVSVDPDGRPLITPIGLTK
jgi:iron complex transport system ATP-binding protein